MVKFVQVPLFIGIHYCGAYNAVVIRHTREAVWEETMRTLTPGRFALALFVAATGIALLTACGGGGAPATSPSPGGSTGAGTPAPEEIVFITNTPSPTGIVVQDQSIEGGTVTVDSVDSDRVAWIVIRADRDGQPGAVLGHAAVSIGSNDNLIIEIDIEEATPTLFAVLHVDAGTPGKFEYPGGYDIAHRRNNELVQDTFQVTGGLP